MAVTILLPPPKNERQWSVNDFWSCIMDTQSAMYRRRLIINALAAIIAKNASDDIATT